MKNAAVILGIIGGVIGIFVGLAVTGWMEFTGWFNAQVPEAAIDTPGNARQLAMVGLFAPILAIAGGAMSGLRPYLGAIFMGLSAAGMYWAFGFGVFTMFPIAMCALACVLGLAGAATREPGGMPRGGNRT